jgi:hypothetical protein
MAERDGVRVGRLVLVPAILTLAVTLARLAGELLGGSDSMFSREAGGKAALVGIVWLIPLFGIYFGLRLARMDAGPASLGRAFGFAALGLLVNTGLGFAAFNFVKSPVAQLGIFALTSWLAIAIARAGWPPLWRVLLAYAFAARLPVLIVMFLSIFGGWDTHYAKPRPDFPAMGPWGLFFWTALLPQFSVWIYLTVVGGILFGALAAAVHRVSGRTPEGAEARAA